ncbi:MAG: winged helix-turn-helix domain-containing protein [Acidimicrobiia bacterium]
MDVVLVRWPGEEDRRERLAVAGTPRLLLVESGASPPEVVDTLEDWVRVPADEAEVQARLSTLSRRSNSKEPSLPSLDDDGVIRHSGLWTSLPPVEARIVEILLERFGAVVSREQLATAGWPEGAPGRNALDVHMLRLRRRLGSVGLSIKTVRSRGYLLERSDSRHQSAREA